MHAVMLFKCLAFAYPEKAGGIAQCDISCNLLKRNFKGLKGQAESH
jgi:hypothetical protein